MTKRLGVLLTTVLTAPLLTSPAPAFEARETKTEARALPPSPILPVVQVEFGAELSNDDFREVPFQDVVVSWQRAGGIEPHPFLVVMPAGCFVPNQGFHVGDYRACGVRVEFETGRGLTALPITDFEARLAPRSDGSYHFQMIVGAQPSDDQMPAILGTLGGGAVEIAIGLQSVMTVPLAVEALGGQPPDDT